MTRISPRSILARACILLVAGLAPGCFTTKQPAPQQVQKLAEPKQVRTSGACIDLGEGHQPAYSVEELVDKVAEMLAAKRIPTARHFAGLFPDLSLDALRRANTAEGKADALQLIAAVHDEQT